MIESTRDLTRLLEALEADEPGALDAVFPVLYDELRAVARARRGEWRGNFTLDTTALIHEAYLKLAGAARVRAGTRAHFLSLASRAMRQILINYARDRCARKRGGDVEKVTFDSGAVDAKQAERFGDREASELVALDDALTRLAEVEERPAAVVECRCFGSMTIDETAEALGVSSRTVKRDWAVALAWLQRALAEGAAGSETRRSNGGART